MGIVGTIIVQNIAIQIPRKKEGNQATKELPLKEAVDSVNIMKR